MRWNNFSFDLYEFNWKTIMCDSEFRDFCNFIKNRIAASVEVIY